MLLSSPCQLLCGEAARSAYIQNAAAIVAPCLHKGNLVVLESLRLSIATENLAEWLSQTRLI